MIFVDHAHITVKAGSGGRGCSSFAQPPYIRYPYPDGGDGGDGGDVILRTDPNTATLLDFKFHHEFSGERGGHGGSNQKTGKRGKDCVILVPVGTVVADADTAEVLRDLDAAGEDLVAARGGQGGLGNDTLAAIQRSRAARTPKRRLKAGSRDTVALRRILKGQEPQESTVGTPGDVRRLSLELKLIADVGLIGCPNAGKSSLLARISTARPRVGPYPFTTRYPVLGVVRVDAQRSFVACDIPGLIEGAHVGKGLGIEFLRHIERTRLLVHVVDMAGVDGRDPLEAFRQVNHELQAYSPLLSTKPQLIVANKMDLPESAEHLKTFERSVRERVQPISCATGAGIPALIQAIWEALPHE